MKPLHKILLLIFSVSFLFSCDNLKRSTRRAYEKIEHRPPISLDDSNRLAKRSLATFPVKEGVIKPGQILPAKPDSTAFYKEKIKTLTEQGPKIVKAFEIQYKDTCISAVGLYEQGVNFGYDVGYYEAKAQFDTPRIERSPDTLLQTPPEMEVKMRGMELTLSKLKTDYTKQEARLADSQKKAKTRLWILIAIGAVIGIITGVKIYSYFSGGKIIKQAL